MISLFVAIVLAAQAPATGDWLTIHEDADAVIAVDKSAITRDGDRVRARMRATFAHPYNGMRSKISEVELDCRALTVRITTIDWLGEDGRLLGRTAKLDDPPANLAGTADLPMMEAICHRTE